MDTHFTPYIPCFESSTRSVAEAAKVYLRGLFQASRANMECMADVVATSHYQWMHHMLSESAWDRAGARRQLVADANAHFGRGGTAFVIDESEFAKKGEHSAGVARQWNGRLGKTDNSQVGVFAAITRGGVAALVDAELYLPESWASDPARCKAAGIPESAQTFRTKGEMALGMVLRARCNRLQLDCGWPLMGATDSCRGCSTRWTTSGKFSSPRCIRIRRSICLTQPLWCLNKPGEGERRAAAGEWGGASGGSRLGYRAAGKGVVSDETEGWGEG